MARIGIDARLSYYRPGGIAGYTTHLIEALSTVDGKNDYLILHQRKDTRNLAQGANQHKKLCWTPAHHRLERLALAVEVFPMKLDVLHSPDFIPPHNGRYRSVITVHDLAFLHYPDHLTADSRRYYNDQIQAAASRADHIICVSEATRADVLDLMDVESGKVSAVWSGIGEQFRPVKPEAVDHLRKVYRLPQDYILFVGTIEPRKNVTGLLRAYKLLRESSSDAPPLVIAGARGWNVEQIFSVAGELELGESVVWLDEITYGDLPALYSGARVFCLPSFYEGFGFPPLEAMACGTPVVVADRASLPEVAGDAGLLVDPESPESIAGALQQVLGDSVLAEKLRERGFENVKRFSWQKTAQRVVEIYEQVMA